jgi:hypothetical protein
LHPDVLLNTYIGQLSVGIATIHGAPNAKRITILELGRQAVASLEEEESA